LHLLFFQHIKQNSHLDVAIMERIVADIEQELQMDSQT